MMRALVSGCDEINSGNDVPPKLFSNLNKSIANDFVERNAVLRDFRKNYHLKISRLMLELKSFKPTHH
jgi:hypothetical protein